MSMYNTEDRSLPECLIIHDLSLSMYTIEDLGLLMSMYNIDDLQLT